MKKSNKSNLKKSDNKNNKTLYIIIAVIVILVLAFLVYNYFFDDRDVRLGPDPLKGGTTTTTDPCSTKCTSLDQRVCCSEKTRGVCKKDENGNWVVRFKDDCGKDYICDPETAKCIPDSGCPGGPYPYKCTCKPISGGEIMSCAIFDSCSQRVKDCLDGQKCEVSQDGKTAGCYTEPIIECGEGKPPCPDGQTCVNLGPYKVCLGPFID